MTDVVPVPLTEADQSKPGNGPTSALNDDSQLVIADSSIDHRSDQDHSPRSHNETNKDKDKGEKIQSEISKGDDPDMPVHILSGNLHHTLPYSDGCSAPLTAQPFALSRIYEHLVASPEEFRAVLIERLGRLQVTLPQLGSDQLRQAKADMVYLKTILEDEGPAVAQIKAGAVWSSTV